jgi:hypothetical protein
LLLAEFYTQQRIQDSRTYKLMLPHMGADPPKAEELFPLLKTVVDPDDEDNVEMIFHSVVGTLSKS